MKSLFSRFRSREEGPSAPGPSNSNSASHGHRAQSLRPGPSPLPPSIHRSSTPIASLHGQSSSSASVSASGSASSSTSISPDPNSDRDAKGQTYPSRPNSVGPIKGYSSGQLVPPPSSWDDQAVNDGGGGDDTVRQRTVSGPGADGTIKKVTFRSPIPTQIDITINTSGHSAESRAMPPPSLSGAHKPRNRTSSFNLRPNGGGPPSPSKRLGPSPLPNGPGPLSGYRSTSRQSLPLTPRGNTNSHKTSMATMSSGQGYEHGATSPTKSTDSSIPSHGSYDASSMRSYLPPPNSWSEMAEEELIANLGPKERTRQEVLWEIVSSEERYVQELIKLNETFCKHLLPASATSPSLTLYDLNATLARTLSHSLSPTPNSFTGSFDHLPIAARYASPVLNSTNSPDPGSSSARMNAYNALTLGVGPPPASVPMRQASSNTLNATNRTHQSLPPPPRSVSAQATTTRMSFHPTQPHPGKLHKHEAGSPRITSGSSTSSLITGRTVLPEDLEKVLYALAGGILEGHIKLAAALRKRYENQYPLVRSLADVFNAHSYILREYATYVLHLEKALGQVDSALSTYTQSVSRRASRRLEDTDYGRLGKTLIALEELAAERGESGLVISLSKPFQRLLKYPLLFQNLLFNTDPSLKEYEATLGMVDDVEEIVRSIEDEKASAEEREKTRDVWARIEGLERDKVLMAPKPNRLLVNESQLPEKDAMRAAEATKSKKSLKRLSDILRGGASSDLWVVRFSDVSLLCERTGMTSLPLSTLKSSSKRDSSSELNGRTKFATTGKRGNSIKARNLYKFIKVHQWHLKPKMADSEGVLSMADIPRARATQEKAATSEASSSRTPHSSSSNRKPISSTPSAPQKPLKVPLKGDGGPSPTRSTAGRSQVSTGDTDTVVSDRMSVMSFAFKGADQVRPHPKRTTKPLAPPSNTANRALQPRAERRLSGQNPSAANAKFAHRLRANEDVNGNPGDATVRPPSKARRSLPPAMLARDGAGTTSRTGSPALSPTTRNTNTPSGPAPTKKVEPKAGVKAVQPEKGNSNNNNGLGKSQLPIPSTPGRRSSYSNLRGVKGTAPPSTTTSALRKRQSQGSLVSVSNRIQAFEGTAGGLNGNGIGGGGSTNGLRSTGMSNSASKDSGMALWAAYSEAGIVGSGMTPVKGGGGTGVGGARSRQLGGRI